MPHSAVSTRRRSSSLGLLFIIMVLVFAAQGADGFMPYMACRAACNSAFLSCMSVYGNIAICQMTVAACFARCG